MGWITDFATLNRYLQLTHRQFTKEGRKAADQNAVGARMLGGRGMVETSNRLERATFYRAQQLEAAVAWLGGRQI